MAKQERPYGLWDSPITLDTLTQDSVWFEGARSSAAGVAYLAERNSTGRTTLLQLVGPDAREVLPAEYSVATSVHEYGGAGFACDNMRQAIVFSNKHDSGVYLLHPDSGEVQQIVQRDGCRFADFDVSPSGWIVAIRETHDVENDLPETVVNELVLIEVESREVRTLVTGEDFYSHPRFGPDGKRLCWMQWNHPEMPWTGSVLQYADFDEGNGSLTSASHVAGSHKRVGLSQPRWGVDSFLFYATDESGYFQLRRTQAGGDSVSHPVVQGLENTEHAAAEFKLGSYTYLPLSAKQLVLSYFKDAVSCFALVDLTNGSWSNIDIPITDAAYDAMCKTSETEFLVHGSAATETPAVYKVEVNSASPTVSVIRRSFELSVPKEYLSSPRVVVSPRLLGDVQDGEVYGLLHEPTNPKFTAPEGTLPPLIVFGHGGPTGHFKPYFDYELQYWTSRGYAMLLLNYAGSTGYGKTYRDLLDGRWGAVDSADAASLAMHLGNEGVVEKSKLGIYGPSAGGYLALKTICDFPDVWAASVSLFGIADISIFNGTTHKFESHYAEALLYPDPVKMTRSEKDQVDKERSPLTLVDNVKAPLLLLHGEDDKVVPPEQSKAMRKGLEEQGKVVRLEMFSGEGHARWQGASLHRSLTAQEEWWRAHLVRV